MESKKLDIMAESKYMKSFNIKKIGTFLRKCMNPVKHYYPISDLFVIIIHIITGHAVSIINADQYYSMLLNADQCFSIEKH